jgi:hypothetical protein
MDDLKKTLGKNYQDFDGLADLDYLYLYITDAESVIMPGPLPTGIAVIDYKQQNKFYGDYRENLKRLRDVPMAEKFPELEEYRKAQKKRNGTKDNRKP